MQVEDNSCGHCW